MYGILLRLDAGRQERVGTDPLKKLLSPAVYKAIQKRSSCLNASMLPTSPFVPTLIRPSFYPDFFRATDIRTLYWKVKNLPDMRGLVRVYVDPDSRIVFDFDTVNENTFDNLVRTLHSFGHYQFSDPKVSGKKISFDVTAEGYPREGEV